MAVQLNFNALPDDLQPGLYVFSSESQVKQIKQLANKRELRLFVIEGKTIHSKEDFIDAVRSLISCPYLSEFGYNWDSLEDCLKDLEWFTEPGFVILYSEAFILQDTAPEDFAVARDILESVERRWRTRQNRPMYVFTDWHIIR